MCTTHSVNSLLNPNPLSSHEHVTTGVRGEAGLNSWIVNHKFQERCGMSFRPGIPTRQTVGRNVQEILPISKEALAKLAGCSSPISPESSVRKWQSPSNWQLGVEPSKSCDSGVSCFWQLRLRSCHQVLQVDSRCESGMRSCSQKLRVRIRVLGVYSEQISSRSRCHCWKPLLSND
jgi:hypothetical protein